MDALVSKEAAQIDELWNIAEGALAEANAMPWGPKRLEALRKAGRLRNDAALKEIEIGLFKKIRLSEE